jgi:hypothetical protein
VTLVANSLEGGTAGTTITTGNSGGASGTAFDIVSVGAGSTGAFDNSFWAHGSLSASFSTGSAGNATHVGWSTALGTLSQAWFCAYFYFSSVATSIRIISGRAGGSAAASILMTGGGGLSIQDSTFGNSVNFTHSVPANAWIRLEGWIIGSATVGQVQCSLFLSPESFTATEIVTTIATYNTSGSLTQYWYGDDSGSGAPNAPQFWIDDMAWSSTGPIGPVNGVTSQPPYRGGQAYQRRQKVRRQRFLPSTTVAPPVVAPTVTPGFTIAERPVITLNGTRLRNNAYIRSPFVPIVTPAPMRAAPVARRTRLTRALARPAFVTPPPTIVTGRTLAVRNLASVRKRSNIAGGIYPLKVSPGLIRAVRPPVVTRRFVAPQRGQPTVTTIFVTPFTAARRPPQQIRKVPARRAIFVPPIVVNPVYAVRARLQTREPPGKGVVFVTPPATIVTGQMKAILPPRQVRKGPVVHGSAFVPVIVTRITSAVRARLSVRKDIGSGGDVGAVFVTPGTIVAPRPVTAVRPPRSARKGLATRFASFVTPFASKPVTAVRPPPGTRKSPAARFVSFVTPGTVIVTKPVSAVRPPRQVRKSTAARPASFVTPSTVIVTKLVSAVKPSPSTRQARGSRAASFVSAAATIVTRQTKAVRSPPATRKDIGSGGDIGAVFVTSPAVIVVHPVAAVRVAVPVRKPSGDKGAAFVTVTAVVVTQPVRAARTRPVIRRGVTTRGQSTAAQPQTPQFVVAERNALPQVRKRFSFFRGQPTGVQAQTPQFVVAERNALPAVRKRLAFFRGQPQAPTASQFTIAERNAIPQTRKRLAFFKGTPAPPVPIVPGRVLPIKVPPQTRKLPRAFFRGIPTPPVPIRVKFTQAIRGLRKRIHFPGTGFGTKYIPPPPPLYFGGTVIASDSLAQTVVAAEQLKVTVLATDKIVGVTAADSLAVTVIATDKPVSTVSALDYYL